MKENFAIRDKSKKPKVIAVVGATASGKTAFAIELAKKMNGEIVSADSRLVYRGFDIGTAKPSLEEQKEVPHHMIDIVEPENDYSAGVYAVEAGRVVNSILEKGCVPIVVGGTGLYFRVLLEGYDMPDVKPDYELRKELQMLSNAELYSMLKSISSTRAGEIELNDKRKLIRAIELERNLEKPLSEHKKEPEYDVEWIGLNFPRKELYERIERRVDLMIDNGLIDETKRLLEKHGRIKNLVGTIGYREITAYLDGVMSFDEAVNKLKQNTRNYAKRQLTWFRKNPLIKWNVQPEKLKK